MRNDGARRVAITGMGALTPLGNSLQEFWQGCLEGRSGIDYLTRFDPKTARIRTSSDGPGWLVFRLVYMREFKARVDGVPSQVFRVNGYHSGVPLEAAVHSVEIYFEPSKFPFHLTLVAWAAVSLGSATWGALRRRQNRKGGK